MKKNWVALISLGVVSGFALSAVADNDHDGHGSKQRTFRAKLVGLSEVPSVSSVAQGQFYAVVNKEGTALTYWLSYSGLEFDASQSHIHFGQHHTNGGISVWLCQGTLAAPAAVAAQTPTCAARTTGTPITATIDASDVIGPGGQGISANEFAALLAAMRAGAAYANVHSGVAANPGNPTAMPPVPATPAVGFPGGEIRGQIN
jgi:hypothetical protein